MLGMIVFMWSVLSAMRVIVLLAYPGMPFFMGMLMDMFMGMLVLMFMAVLPLPVGMGMLVFMNMAMRMIVFVSPLHKLLLLRGTYSNVNSPAGLHARGSPAE